MSDIKDAAKALAEAGYPSLQLYKVVQNEDGELECNCGKHGQRSCNPGKHPLFGEKGVHSATTDVDLIDTWPETGINLGVAGRDTYPFVDLDHEPTVKKVRAELIRRGTNGVVDTGSGNLHIYLQSAPTKNGVLFSKDGTRLGEIRAAGYYVVAPPSFHIAGGYYTWANGNVVDTGPEVTTADGWGWTAELLGAVGIEMLDKKESGQVVGREATGAIEPVSELPFVSENAKLQSMLDPSYPVDNDRSDELFALACEIVRECNTALWEIDGETETSISLETIAGLVKYADINRIHPRGPKFANRANSDRYFWELVNAAVHTVKKAPAGVLPVRQIDYGYNPDDGFYIDEPGPKDVVKRRRIANFEAKWIESLITWRAAEDIVGEDDSEETRHLQVTHGDFTKLLVVPSSAYSDHRKLAPFVEQRIPSHFVIEPRMDSYFKAGLGHYSGVIPTRQIYAATGWLPDQDAFLLPGMPGAITADGWDETIRFESDKMQDMMYARTFDEDASVEAYLRLLFVNVPPPVLVPLLTQILAAPLSSLGFDERTMMHLLGATGSYKSSLIIALLSVYGYVKGDAQGRVSWQAGTDNSIRLRQNMFRDMPVLLDDFKSGLIPKAVVDKLIQQYGDGTGRQRLTRTLKQQEAHPNRGLSLSSGEQWWGGQRSTNYRTLLVRIQKGVMSLDQMIAIADAAKAGKLAAIGIQWIRWLVRTGRENVRQRLQDEMDTARPKITDMVGEEHARHVSAITSLYAVNRMLIDFVAEVAPGFVQEYRKASSLGWLKLIGSAQEQAEEGREVSPLAQLLTAMRQAVETGMGYLAPRRASDSAWGKPMGVIIGYHSDGEMWLHQWTTFGWYLKELRGQSSNATVDWDSILQDAKENYGGRYDPTYYHDLAKSEKNGRERMLRLPVSLLEIGETEHDLLQIRNDVTGFDVT